MDMSSVGRDRLIRVAKILVIATVVVFVLVLLLNGFNRRSSLTQNGMMRPGSLRNFQTEQGSGMMGGEVSSPMMDYGEVGRTLSKTSAVSTGVPVSAPAPDGNNVSTDKKIIKTGDLVLKVESVEKTLEQVRWTASQFGGDVFSSSLYDANTANSVKSGRVTIKVPIEHFDEALRSITSAARVVVRETTSGQDVTSDYVDLQARLKNKQAEEESIAAILTRDTNKINDVLTVTIELARARGEIEQLQAQVKYLDNQTDMSTITVSFTEDTQIGKTDAVWRPTQEVKDAVNALIKASQRALSFLISFIIVVVPVLGVLLLIFGGILYVVIKKLYQKLNR